MSTTYYIDAVLLSSMSLIFCWCCLQYNCQCAPRPSLTQTIESSALCRSAFHSKASGNISVCLHNQYWRSLNLISVIQFRPWIKKQWPVIYLIYNHLCMPQFERWFSVSVCKKNRDEFTIITLRLNFPVLKEKHPVSLIISFVFSFFTSSQHGAIWDYISGWLS